MSGIYLIEAIQVVEDVPDRAPLLEVIGPFASEAAADDYASSHKLGNYGDGIGNLTSHLVWDGQSATSPEDVMV